MSYNIEDKCQKEIKALGKKYMNLGKDLEVFIQTHLAANNTEQKEDFRRNFFNSKNVSVLHQSLDGQSKIVKARLYSSDLKDKSLRVIYRVENDGLTLIEIYSKSQKPSEDKRRWQPHKSGQ